MTADQTVTRLPAPRHPLLNEMMGAFDTALTLPADTSERRFYEGVGIGYAVAFGFVTREALDTARRTPGSSNTHIDFRKPSGLDEPTTLWACGVRHGYYLGTSERDDAEDCAACGERLTEDDDAEACEDGWFCPGWDNDCWRMWHQNGPAVCRLEALT